MEKTVLETYTKSDFKRLHQWLLENSNEKFRRFNEGLIPGSESKSYGVRVPILRAKAKEILKADWRGFLEYARGDENYEITMLHGMVAVLGKLPLEQKLKLFRDYIPRVNNWAFCDIVCGDFKEIKKHRERGYEFIENYLHSEQEFEVRVAVVLLLQHYLVEEYIDRVLADFIQISHQGYYVKMAVAWGMSVCYVKFPEKTYPLLEQRILEEDTHKKTMQKIRDSLRVSKEQKKLLRREGL